MVVLASQPVMAVTYAAMVMDARDGSVLHTENADQRLHPASLTKRVAKAEALTVASVTVTI